MLAATVLSLPLVASAQEPTPKTKKTSEKTVSSASAPIKHSETAPIKTDTSAAHKIAPDLKAAGRDNLGRRLYKNSSGEVFYLDSKTGDMIPVKSSNPPQPAETTVVKSRSNVKNN